MSLRNTYQSYGLISKLLHAIIALLVICMLSVSFFMSDIGISNIYTIHKLTGLSILSFAIIMLVWELFNPKPAYPITMARWEQILAKSVHHCLLLLIILMPMSGWIFSTAAGKPPMLINITLPFPGIAHSQTVIHLFKDAHKVIAWIIIGLLSLHILVALKHWLLNKDGIMQRMWSFSQD